MVHRDQQYVVIVAAREQVDPECVAIFEIERTAIRCLDKLSSYSARTEEGVELWLVTASKLAFDLRMLIQSCLSP